jgi:hypothetical protein
MMAHVMNLDTYERKPTLHAKIHERNKHRCQIKFGIDKYFRRFSEVNKWNYLNISSNSASVAVAAKNSFEPNSFM